VDGLPWWPRLLGDLPSAPKQSTHIDNDGSERSIDGMGVDIEYGGSSSGGDDGNIDYQPPTAQSHPTYNTHLGDSFYPHSSDPTRGTQEEHEHDYDYSSPTIHSAIGKEDTTWAAPKLHTAATAHASQQHSNPTSKTNMRSKGDRAEEYTHNNQKLATEGSLDLLFELNANKKLINQLRSTHISAVRFMHQMVFDEESSVNIIENDCICNQWNVLDYKF
jgi:hypothetical protein